MQFGSDLQSSPRTQCMPSASVTASATSAYAVARELSCRLIPLVKLRSLRRARCRLPTTLKVPDKVPLSLHNRMVSTVGLNA